MRAAVALASLIALGACSAGEEAVVAEDPSKLSAELEARADEIEARADAAAAAVEQEAAEELAQIAQESEAVEPISPAETTSDDAG